MDPRPTAELAELETPPVKIANGLATKLGLAGTAAALIPLAVDLVTDERIDPATRRLLIVAAAGLAAVVILGRMAQAIAAELARGRAAGVAVELEPEPDPAIRELEARLRSMARTVTTLEKAEAARRLAASSATISTIGRTSTSAFEDAVESARRNVPGLSVISGADTPATGVDVELEAEDDVTAASYIYRDEDDDPDQWAREDDVPRNHAGGNPEEG